MLINNMRNPEVIHTLIKVNVESNLQEIQHVWVVPQQASLRVLNAEKSSVQVQMHAEAGNSLRLPVA